jgi:dynein intermediate chain 1
MVDASTEESAKQTPELMKAMQILERIVHTNSEAEVFQDYKYFEDKSELKREDGRGSFLPLFRFAFAQAHRKTVTSITWNPVYTDLFAVCYSPT